MPKYFQEHQPLTAVDKTTKSKLETLFPSPPT